MKPETKQQLAAMRYLADKKPKQYKLEHGTLCIVLYELYELYEAGDYFEFHRVDWENDELQRVCH